MTLLIIRVKATILMTKFKAATDIFSAHIMGICPVNVSGYVSVNIYVCM